MLTYIVTQAKDDYGVINPSHFCFTIVSAIDIVHDSYTGDPWNPIHAFTESGAHEVFLKVTDSCSGEYISNVTFTIEFV